MRWYSSELMTKREGFPAGLFLPCQRGSFEFQDIRPKRTPLQSASGGLGVIRDDFSRYLGKTFQLWESSISGGSVTGLDVLEILAAVDRARLR